MARFAGLRDPVTMDFENSTIAYCVDAFSIVIGALLGTSPVTAFIESATGISGKLYHSSTLWMLIHVFGRGREDRYHCNGDWDRILSLCVLFSYLRFHSWMGNGWCLNHRWIVNDPQVRVWPKHYFYRLSLCSVREIDWDYPGDAVPAFLTIIIIPLTFKYVFEELLATDYRLTITSASRTGSLPVSFRTYSSMVSHSL